MDIKIIMTFLKESVRSHKFPRYKILCNISNKYAWNLAYAHKRHFRFLTITFFGHYTTKEMIRGILHPDVSSVNNFSKLISSFFTCFCIKWHWITSLPFHTFYREKTRWHDIVKSREKKRQITTFMWLLNCNKISAFFMTEFLIVCRAYIQKSHEFLNTIFFLFSNLIFVNVHTIKMIKVLVWILLFPFLQWKEIGNDGIIGDDDCRISSQWEFRCKNESN